MTQTDILKIKSEYLCELCKNLLFIDVKTRDEFCLNRDCSNFPPLQLATDTTQINRDIKERENQLLIRMAKFNADSFIRFITNKRIELIKNFFLSKMVYGKEFFALNELLIKLNLHKPVGTRPVTSDYTTFLRDYVNFVEILNMKEDVENRRSIISTNAERILMVKYWDVFLQLYSNYGITSGNKNVDELFAYLGIDTKSLEGLDFRVSRKFDEFFKKNFRLIITMRYALGRYYRTSLQFNYSPKRVDIAALLGLTYSLRYETEEWSLQGIKNHFLKYSDENDFRRFKNEYISGDKAPIIIDLGNGKYLVDKYTLLFFIFHLVGQDEKNPAEKHTDEGIVTEAKKLAGKVFEDTIRGILRAKSFVVTEKPLVVREANEEYEYDVIGVNENAKKIILIEAKYRDLPPSSISGKNLINQELIPLDDEGLLGKSLKQIERHNFFVKNFERFKKELGLKEDVSSYKVIPTIVTKYKPLIRNYDFVELLELNELETSDSLN